MAPTVLVCGGAGYIGSHTVLELLRTNKYNVVVFDNFSTGYRGSMEAVKTIFEQQKDKSVTFNIFEGDVQSEEDLKKVFTSYKIDAVMHFCALIVVPESVSNPLKYYENNVVGTMKMLQQMQAHGVSNFIFSSTAAIFGNPTKVPIEPEDPTEPINPYGETKLVVEKMLKWFDQAYKIRYICLRYFNACGADESGLIGEAHEPETHLIPIILQVPMGKRKSISVFGEDYKTKDGTCVRDYIHVTDLATAHIQALEHLLKGGQSDRFNLGSGQGYTVKEVVDACRKVTGHAIPMEIGPRRPGDPDALIASSTKAEQVLKWNRKYHNIEDIVATAWKWHQANPHGYNK
jgi:UDP-glucose 4-epimerase